MVNKYNKAGEITTKKEKPTTFYPLEVNLRLLMVQWARDGNQIQSTASTSQKAKSSQPPARHDYRDVSPCRRTFVQPESLHPSLFAIN